MNLVSVFKRVPFRMRDCSTVDANGPIDNHLQVIGAAIFKRMIETKMLGLYPLGIYKHIGPCGIAANNNPDNIPLRVPGRSPAHEGNLMPGLGDLSFNQDLSGFRFS